VYAILGEIKIIGGAMSCNEILCSIWHECDKALGSELKPLCASLKEEVAALKAELTQQTANKQSTLLEGCSDWRNGKPCPYRGKYYRV
jgi:phage host-nuclease inhibitor protein Gam